MPRQPGVFKQHQEEILSLLSHGIGYTEIAVILGEKHGVKPTKHNLKQSHQRYLKKQSTTQSKQARKQGAEKRGKRRTKAPVKSAKKCPENALKNTKGIAGSLEFRERAKQIHFELIALLDAEEGSGRFSAAEASLLRGWAQVLFNLKPDLARDSFSDCFGGDFKTYEDTFRSALSNLSKSQLCDVNEECQRPDQEEEFLKSLREKMKKEAEAEGARLIEELVDYLEANPELKTDFDFEFKP